MLITVMFNSIIKCYAALLLIITVKVHQYCLLLRSFIWVQCKQHIFNITQYKRIKYYNCLAQGFSVILLLHF